MTDVSLRTYARTHRFASRLALIAIAGFVLRVVYDVALRHHRVGGDGFRYHFGALFLADGQGFVNPLGAFLGKAHVPDTGHPPAWTILLAGATKVGLRSWLQHQIVTSVVGTATIVMVGLAANAVRGIRAGLIAAALTAVYPFTFLYEREVLSEPLALLGVATTIWVAYRFLEAPGPRLAIALGVLVGLLAMTKSDLIDIAVLLVVPLILSRRSVDIRRRVTWLILAGTVCVAIMAPWSIYLSTRFDRTVLVSGSIGGAMAAGNCAQTYKGERFAYYAFGCNLGLGKSPGPVAPDNIAPDPIAADARLRRRATDYMRDHAGRVPLVMAARIGRTFGVFRPFQQMRLETERGTPEWVFRVGFFAYWALLPLAAAGAVITRRRGTPIYPLLTFPVAAALSVLLTIGAVRYRAPAEIVLVILAAVALDAAFSAWRQA